MKKIIGIYCIENIDDGKKYIGYTRDINHRWYIHKWLLRGNNHTNEYLQYAYNKYGEEKFKFWIIQEMNTDDIYILGLMETYWIVYYESHRQFGKGYNLTFGGDGSIGFIPTEEQRRKSSESRMGSKNFNFGRHFSEEARSNMSKGSMGKILTDEHKRNIGKAFKGILFSEDHSNKIGNSNRGLKKIKNSSSRYVGVSFIKSMNQWGSGITFNKQHFNLGYYESENDAARAYNRKAIELMGDSARLNIITD
jgi:group I intron endonuclease